MIVHKCETCGTEINYRWGGSAKRSSVQLDRYRTSGSGICDRCHVKAMFITRVWAPPYSDHGPKYLKRCAAKYRELNP